MPEVEKGWGMGANLAGNSKQRLILASGSESRRRVMQAAGLEFEAIPADIDEASVRDAMRADRARCMEVAERLAELKALKISQNHPDALVIGSDQILDFEGAWFEKPADRAQARAHLIRLRGQTHELVTAVVVCRAGARIWEHRAVARLTMRDLSDDFIETYLTAARTGVLSSVGAYQLEGLGAQLFLSIEGDFFSVLGLPLLPLLEFLREEEVVAR